MGRMRGVAHAIAAGAAAMSLGPLSVASARVDPGTRGERGASGSPAVSASGRYVAFTSSADDLVAGDTNRSLDVFVRDRGTGRTERVSVRTDGGQARRSGAGSGQAAISGDGRFVAFASAASNLVAGDTNHATDVFLRDRVAGNTVRVSVGSGGAQSRGPSGLPAISVDGRVVAFVSAARNLVARDTNRAPDVFVRDLAKHTTERVSVSALGAQVRKPVRLAAAFGPAAVGGRRDRRVRVAVVRARGRRPQPRRRRLRPRPGGGDDEPRVGGLRRCAAASGRQSRAVAVCGRQRRRVRLGRRLRRRRHQSRRGRLCP